MKIYTINITYVFQCLLSLKKGEKAPLEYKRIPGFSVFDAKHDLRRKARLAPKEDIYSGVIDHENVRLTLLITELNELEVMAADIGTCQNP